MSDISSGAEHCLLQPDPLQLTRYLTFVDDQIAEEGFELLKLSLYAHESLPWIEAVKCDKPSALFKLLETRPSTENALRLLLFSLRAIGGKTHGKYCASEAEKYFPTPSQVNPNPKTRQFCLPSELEIGIQTRKFRLFQWLVKVSRKLPPDASERIIRHFANNPGVKTNRRNYKGLPQLFIDLHQKGVIMEDNTSALEIELKRCRSLYASDEQAKDLAELQKCINYLERFHSTQQPEVFYFSEGDDDSTAPSMEESTGISASGEHESEGSHVTTKGGKKKVFKHTKGQKRKRESDEIGAHEDSPPGSLPDDPFSISTDVLSGTFSRQQSGASIATLVPGSVRTSRFPSTSQKSGQPCRTTSSSPSQHGHTAHAQIATTEYPRPPDRTLPINDLPEPPLQTPGTNDLDGTWVIAKLDQEYSLNRPQLESIEAKRRRKRFCRRGFIALFIIVFVFLPLPLFSTLVWSPLHKLSSPLITLQRQGAAVILDSVNAFLTETVSITEQVNHHDSPHMIDTYLTSRGCEHLPTYWNISEYNATDLRNTTPVYMLAGSRLSFDICASTEYEVKDNIELYIVAGLNDILRFNPDEAQEDKHYYYKSIPVGDNGDMPCTKASYHVHSPNYYTSIFLIPPQPLNITYQLNTSVLSINVTALELASTHVGTLHEDNDEIHTSLKFHACHKCLIALIHPGKGQRKTVHIKLNFVQQESAIYVSFITLFPFLVVLFFAVIYCIKRRHSITHFVHVHLSGYSPL